MKTGHEPETLTNRNEPSLIGGIVFLGLVAMQLPLAWLRPFIGKLPYFGEVIVFSPGLVAMFCGAMLLWDFGRVKQFFTSTRPAKFYIFLLLLWGVVPLIRGYNGCDYLGWFEEIFWSLSWLLIPLFCVIHLESIKRYFPRFVITLGLVSLWQSLFWDNQRPFGFCGNWNWNATLLALSAVFVIAWVGASWSLQSMSKRFIRCFCGAAYVVLSSYVIIWCNSKGTFLASLVGIGIAALLLVGRRFAVQKRATALVCLGGSCVALLLLFLGIVFYFYNSGKLDHDVRVYLWEGTIKLIKQNFLLGVGHDQFESAIAPLVPTKYYTLLYATDRNTHPHNNFLYIAATLGLPVLLSWLTLLSVTVAKSVKLSLKDSIFRREHLVYLIAFVVVITHAMFDIIGASWPLNYCFLIILGILLGGVIDKGKQAVSSGIESQRYLIPKAISIILFVLLTALVTLKAIGGCYYREALCLNARPGMKQQVIEYGDKSISYYPTPKNLYLNAIISFFDFQDGLKTLSYLQLMKDYLGIENYVNNNLVIARALCSLGKKAEALPYFEQEAKNFPLSIVNSYFYYYTLRSLVGTAAAETEKQKLLRLLNIKGFNWSQVRWLVMHPKNDLRYVEYHLTQKNIKNNPAQTKR